MDIAYIKVPYKISLHQYVSNLEIKQYINEDMKITSSSNTTCFINLLTLNIPRNKNLSFSSQKQYVSQLTSAYCSAFPRISQEESKWIQCYIMCALNPKPDIANASQLEEMYNLLNYTPQSDELIYFYKRMLLFILDYRIIQNKPIDDLLQEVNKE